MGSKDFSDLPYWLAEYGDAIQRSIREHILALDRVRVKEEELELRQRLVEGDLAMAKRRLAELSIALDARLGAQITGLRAIYEKLETRLNAVDEMFQAVPSLEVSLDRIASYQRTTETDPHYYLAAQSLGLDLASVPLPRFVPIRIYLSTASKDEIADVVRALDGVSNASGFEACEEFPAEVGSWWKKWFVKTKDELTQPEVQQRLEKVERTVELAGLVQPQANVDKTEAEAAATLIRAIRDVPNAAIQTGSLLLVKTTGKGEGSDCLQVRTLTQREMIHLERHQDLLKSPGTILERLTEASDTDHTPPPGRVLT